MVAGAAAWPYFSHEPGDTELDEDNQDMAPIGAAKWTAKHDATTKAAMDIIERERAERDAKTARLKAARLAKEEETTSD